MALSSIVCLGRRTITGLLTTQGKQFVDWSADYRIFERERIDIEFMFNQLLSLVEENLRPREVLSLAIDDTRVKKKGKKISGAKWDRDPLGPPFHTNFIWGQRFLQISAMLPEEYNIPSRARAIPVDFKHCPTLPKPKKNAPEQEWENWKKESKKFRLPLVALERIKNLKNMTDRMIIVSVDGGYTNRTFIKPLPDGVTAIGRVRKDAKLFAIPDAKQNSRGRRVFYGVELPTPEAYRQDDSIPWQKVTGFAAGKTHTFYVKTVESVRWRGSSDKNLRLVIIRPLRYRLTKKSRLLYRDPAYLICTDPKLPLEEIIKNYLWRWEIEVNFRDEKSLLGLGEAQTRTASAAALVPEFKAATYASLLLASFLTYGFGQQNNFVLPKWRVQKDNARLTTQNIINLMRVNLWGKTLGIENKNDFMTSIPVIMKSHKISNGLSSAIYFSQ